MWTRDTQTLSGVFPVRTSSCGSDRSVSSVTVLEAVLQMCAYSPLCELQCCTTTGPLRQPSVEIGQGG